jgi:hypothetical protein
MLKSAQPADGIWPLWAGHVSYVAVRPRLCKVHYLRIAAVGMADGDGFVAQIGLRSISPLPQTDLAYSDGTWYAKRCEAV